MRLADAYEKLQWGAPLAHERAVMGKAQQQGPVFPRGIGTSAHMLIELYLDMHKDQRDPLNRAAQFLVVCKSGEQGQYLRGWLVRIHRVLDLNVDLDRVRFWPYGRDPDKLRGDKWYSWAIFCDHAVKWVEEDDRNTGPYALVRRLSPTERHVKPGEPPNWKAYDRDGRFLGLLTDAGKNDLLDQATCPITLDGPNSTTYAAFMDPEVSRFVRLRKAYAR
jgi:hypothetical protein